MGAWSAFVGEGRDGPQDHAFRKIGDAPSVLKSYNLWLLAIAGPLLYVAGSWYAAWNDQVPLLDAGCFNAALIEYLAAPRLFAAAVMACGASIVLCFAPWWLGTLAVAARFPGKQFTAHVWSLAGNTAALVIICFVLRHTAGIGRESFLIAWLSWTAALVVLAGAAQSANLPPSWRIGNRRHIIAAVLGIAAVATCLVLFRCELFLQCFNGDGTELDELARSLRQHLLPYWEIEPTGKFGTAVVNPLVTSSYWTFAFQVLLGDGELPTRLPYWIWWLGIYFAALRMLRFFSALPLALLLLLSALWYTFYAGYDPYQGDIANPGVSDAMFTLWMLMSFDCLRRKDLGGWVASMVAASLLFYAGAVVFVLTIAAALLWQPVPRRDMLRAGLLGGGILVILLFTYLAWGLWEGTLSAWFASFDEEWLSKYFDPQPRGLQGLLFLGYFLLGCGGFAALSLVLVLRRGSPWQRTLATVIAAYLAIILGCGLKNLHYLGPLLPLTVTLWLTATAHGRQSSRHSPSAARPAAPVAGLFRGFLFLADGTRRVPATFLTVRLVTLLATLGLAVSIWLCWPLPQPTFTLNRDLGKKTVFRTSDYEEACRWARIRSPLYQRGDLGWQISQHTWVGYAARSAGGKVLLPLCVSDGGSPRAGYELVFASPDGPKLYCRDPQLRESLASKRPLAGPERFPWVFQPIAPRPEPRNP
jgi:hypothetical protein